MNLATVIGTIWSTRREAHTAGLSLRIIQPQDAEGRALERPIVAVDAVGCGVGERVFYVSAREAVLALNIPEVPIDASIVGIVEGIELTSEVAP